MSKVPERESGVALVIVIASIENSGNPGKTGTDSRLNETIAASNGFIQMSSRSLSLLFFLAGLPLGTLHSQGPGADIISRLESASEEQLQKMLPRFPGADANGDGRLTREEAVTYAKGMTGGGSEKTAGNGKKGPAPTRENVAYGVHERNVLDFWRAEAEGPRPLVIFIHGGGFTGGDKSKWHAAPELSQLLDSGVSCAAINYRFRKDAPIQDILRDAARALQFLRSQSEDLGIDKTRIAGWGGSAGAGTSLWLATRDDLADAASDDLVLRESSRLQAAVLQSTQATYDLTRWDAFLGPSDPSWWQSPHEAAQFYHFSVMEDLKKPEALPILRECDMLSWISPGDGPVFISNRLPDGPSKDRGHYLHHPAHAREIELACEKAGVPCHWVESPASPNKKSDPVRFVLGALKVTPVVSAE